MLTRKKIGKQRFIFSEKDNCFIVSFFNLVNMFDEFSLNKVSKFNIPSSLLFYAMDNNSTILVVFRDRARFLLNERVLSKEVLTLIDGRKDEITDYYSWKN